MVQEIEVIEIDVDGRTFWVRPTAIRQRGGRSPGGIAGQASGMGGRVLPRQHRTQPGTLDGYIGNIRLRLLGVSHGRLQSFFI
jgi:hypothetical protein